MRVGSFLDPSLIVLDEAVITFTLSSNRLGLIIIVKVGTPHSPLFLSEGWNTTFAIISWLQRLVRVLSPSLMRWRGTTFQSMVS